MPLIRIKYTLLFVTCLFLLNANAQKTFKIQDFVLESGTKLPEISLQYLTYGNLNQQKNNVIVLPTFFAGSLHSYDKWIGNDKPLNPEKYFIIIPSLISGGNSSSPSFPLGASSFLAIRWRYHILILSKISCRFVVQQKHIHMDLSDSKV